MAAAPKKHPRGRKPSGTAKRRAPRGGGTRGPRPTPTAEIERRGGRPRDKGRADREPKPDKYAGTPAAPPHVAAHPYSLHAWDTLAPQLHLSGVLSKADPMTLARYCVLWAVWREASSFVLLHGSAFPLRARGLAPDRPGPLTGFRSYPQARTMMQAAAALLPLERELGLTPAARARLEVDAPPLPGGVARQEDEGDPLFAGG